MIEGVPQSGSDNARGGLRGERAWPTPELIAAICAGFGFDQLYDWRDIGGSSCLNLLMMRDGARYVARVYRPYVTEARLRDIQRVRSILKCWGIPCANLLPAVSGAPYIRYQGRLIEAEGYVDHDGYMDTLAQLKRGLPVLGRMTSALRHVTALSQDAMRPVFANHLPFEQILPATQKGCDRICGWNPNAYERQLVKASLRLAGDVWQAGSGLFERLPCQLAHGDFWDNNVLFRGKAVVLVQDFDFMGKRRRIDDIALTLYYANADLKNAGMPAWRRAEEMKGLLNAYESGLDIPLEPDERAALPIAIAAQPLWSIGGWVATLDSEYTARKHASDMLAYVEEAQRIIDNLARWQAAFMGG